MLRSNGKKGILLRRTHSLTFTFFSLTTLASTNIGGASQIPVGGIEMFWLHLTQEVERLLVGRLVLQSLAAQFTR